jgi:adenosylhomocysteinase|tara:strand:- start:1991 stop:3238 length:1248 start_codon:yes stop_codon:yes gene_type:complete
MLGDIKDVKLANKGINAIEWAAREMPVLMEIKKDFTKKKPFTNINIAACLHVTAETANLLITLKAGGANIYLSASNPLSTQDDVAAALYQKYKIATYAIRGESNNLYISHLKKVASINPNIIVDDGADLSALIIKNKKKYSSQLIGGTEETTTGVIRLKAMSKDNMLTFPVIAVNEAQTKFLFDNRFGTGQSTLDGIIRATDILIAGKKFVVCGYGWCGKGIASRAKGMGAQVIITEVNPMRALEAVMDGFEVMPINEAAKEGDIFVTATGDLNVIDKKSLTKMKSGVFLANAGHFDCEINLDHLQLISKKVTQVNEHVREYITKTNKKLLLIAEGRLVNLGAATGHPASVMDLSFANQALSVEYIMKNHSKLSSKVYDVPLNIDNSIAKLKLSAMKIKIDNLTNEQKKYLNSWE